ncbi:hypothetical protein [Lysobacter sp. Root690]|uniref:hypothetical protein n=1 Tax=Lysobacter sp. Root690 TaxID=1736588 RepID=UPI0006FC8E5D|nr:hypothetical protein [Lysobacter sp. Root690]KRB10297.1 hypothetical protein ASD86_25205 [Lysobacter sp. Root690]
MRKRRFNVVITGTAQGEATLVIEAEDLDAATEQFAAITQEQVNAIDWGVDVVCFEHFVEVHDCKKKKKPREMPWPNYHLGYRLY